MTREEAIEELKYIQWYYNGFKEEVEALDMAIEALSTDEISKERQKIYKLAFTDGYKKAMYVVYECAERDLINKAEVHKVLSLLSTEGGKDAKALFMDAHEWVDGLPSVSEKHQLSEETSTMGVDISTNTSTDLISRDEAIKELKKALSNDGDWYKEEACDIVETTLHDLPFVSEKPQPRVETSDLISRAEALEQMAQAECGLHYEDCEADNCSCPYIGRILDIPPTESDTVEWTPISERLPNTYEEVIVSIIDDSADSRLEKTTVAWRLDEYWISGNDTIGEVVAWMPLPKPYRKDDET